MNVGPAANPSSVSPSGRCSPEKGVVTYSPSITFIPTHSCAFSCGYCAFARPTPLARLAEADACFDRAAGCREVLIMSGEGVERFPAIRETIEKEGFTDYLDYLVAVGRRALGRGLLPHINIGNLDEAGFRYLKTVSPSMGMMLETISDRPLDAHRHATCKTPAARLATIAAAGRAKVPFTTGILVGIGENETDRVASLRAIAELHLRYGHVQEVIVQPFTPHPGTPMADVPPPPFATLRRTVEIAREILPDDVEVQIPPNLVPEAAARLALVEAGARDFGGISPEQDFINPDERWLTPAVYAGELAAAGFELRPRLAVYPQFLNPEWLAPEVLHSAAMVAAARAVPLG